MSDYRLNAIVRKLTDELDAEREKTTKLREALEKIIADCEADYPPSHGAIKYRARAVLEETTNDA